MTTAGLERTNFIDPNLTWKTVSKGTNKSRRSRRSVSNTSKFVQNRAKRNLKQLSETPSSESDKSDVSIERGRLGNMECLPLKKRKFLLRTPSPPPQSPNHREVSQEIDTGRSLLDPQSYANGDVNPKVIQTEISTGSACEKSVLNGNVESIAKSCNGTPVPSDDFSGILILAAAACSGELDSTVGEIGKSKMGGILKQENDEPSFPSEINMKESIVISRSADFPEKETRQLKDEACVVGPPSNSIKSVCSENTTEFVDRSLISEISGEDPNESVVCSIDPGKSIESCGLPDAVNTSVLGAEDSPSNLPNKGIEIDSKTSENPSGQRDYRLHWDLNTVMDEWDEPLDDKFVDSSMQCVEVAQTSAISFQKSENVDVSLATESADRFAAQPVPCLVPESKVLPDCGSFTSVITALNKSGCNSNVSSHLGFKENCSVDGANSNAIETTSKYVMDSKTHKEDIDQSLPLRLNGTKNSVLDKGRDASSFENLVKVAEENSALSLQTGVREIDFSLVPLSGNASCDVKGADSGHSIKGSSLTCQLGSTEFLGADRREFATKASNMNSTETNVPESKILHPLGLHRSVKLEVMVAPLETILNPQIPDTVVAKQNKENPNTQDDSRRDRPMVIEPNVPEVLTPVDSTVNLAKSLGCNTTTVNNGSRDLHISTEVSSQVTENTASVDNSKGRYDSHLEDGELRESVGHFWEDNECEEGETEHVDYDSDNREGIFSDAAYDLNDSVEHDSCLDKFSSDEPSLDKSVVENCSTTLVPCSGAHLGGENGVDNVETDKPGKEYNHDVLRNCRGASASGREIQFSDKNFDPIRRSRSCNFDGMHQNNASMQKDWVDRSWNNVDLKSDVGESVPEADERIVKVQEEVPSEAVRARIISTTRSSYNPMRRGSPVEREHGYGMGMPKGRDFCPSYNNNNNNNYNNPRNRFDRPFNGVNRGFRDGYRRTGPILNNFGKRDRSFSPVENPHFPRNHRKSRSRSRSRSPDFRMGRPRPPYQQHGHTVDHIRERRSPPVRVFNNHQKQRFNNNMGSPGRFRSDDSMRPMTRPNKDHDFVESDHYQRQPHFIRNNRRSRSRSRSPDCSPDFRPDAKMGGMRGPGPYQPPGNYFRGRRSPPVRPFRPNGQRFNNDGESSGRPMMRPGRFNGTSPHNNNGGDEYRRKPRNIFERIHPVRNDDVDGDGRRFPCDEQDDDSGPPHHNNFRRNHNFTRGGGARRPVDGFRRDERGINNIRYNNNNNNPDRMFYSGPKPFGAMRDYTDDTLPRGPRP